MKDLTPAQLPVPLEKDEQEAVVRLFEAVGTIVYRLSQSRATRQTEGLSDLYCFHPGIELVWWWETKRHKGGNYSDAQKFFRELHRSTDPAYAKMRDTRPLTLGGHRGDAEVWIAQIGLGGLNERRQFTLQPRMTPEYFAWKELLRLSRMKARRASRNHWPPR